MFKKISLLILIALFAAGLRFSWLSPLALAECVKDYTYWVLLILLLWGGKVILAEIKGNFSITFSYRKKIAIGVVLLSSFALHIHEPHSLKVNYDESVLVGISRLMHYEHIAAWPAKAHNYFGTPTALALMADKRPVLFPFLVSVLHTTTGYRTANVFVTNGIIGLILITLVYLIGNIYCSRYGGSIFALFILGVPLFAQNVTGGGFDLLNTTLVSGLAYGLYRYFKNPSGRALEILVFIGLCLANTRYESILYVTIAPAAYIYIWIISKKSPELPFSIVLAHIALLPAVLTNGVFQSNDVFFQSKQALFWSIKYIPDNISHAIYYLFNYARGGTNSAFIAYLSIPLSLIGLLFYRRKLRNGHPQPPESLALIFMGAVISINLVIVLGLRWGEWDDPSVSRFTLPLWLLLSWIMIAAIREIDTVYKIKLTKISCFVCVLNCLLFSFPDSSSARQTRKFKASEGLNWSINFMIERDPERRSLILANSAIPYINEGFAAVASGVLATRNDQYLSTIQHGLYGEVIIVSEEIRNHKTGVWLSDGECDKLFEKVNTELIAKKTLDPFYRVKLFLVTATADTQGGLEWPDREIDSEEYKTNVFKLLP
jgi:Dolichyl-phosphate-mannose-protein mannosyltransferase